MEERGVLKTGIAGFPGASFFIAKAWESQKEDIEKEEWKMRAFILYAAVILGNGLLINLSERWYTAAWYTEWLFGLMTIGVFALFLRGWKSLKPRGGGLVFVTALSMLTINSIFFVQNLPAGICSFLLGLTIIPIYATHRDAALAAGGLVLINILMLLEVPSEVAVWLFFWTAGALALIGFRFRFVLVKRCFTVLFSLAALALLFLNFFDGAYLIELLLLVCTLLFIAGAYRFSRRAAL
jgi:hypothetical protein